MAESIALAILTQLRAAEETRREADSFLRQNHHLDAESVLDGMRAIDDEWALAYHDIDSRVTGVLEGEQARHYITIWHAHGLSARQCAILAARNQTVEFIDELTKEIDAYIANRPGVVEERAVLAYHAAGMPLIEIARKVGVTRQHLYKVFARLGVTPNAKQPRVQDEIRNKVIRDRNKGDSQPAICKRYGLTQSQYKSILRYAARNGLVPDYGTRANNNKGES